VLLPPRHTDLATLVPERVRGGRLEVLRHDLQLAAAYCDRVYVMKDGSVVDHQEAGTIFVNPANPYTKALADAVPRLPEREPAAPAEAPA